MARSVDPIKAYKARIELRIYSWLLDLIAKELEAQQEAVKPDKTTVTETRGKAEVQAA